MSEEINLEKKEEKSFYKKNIFLSILVSFFILVIGVSIVAFITVKEEKNIKTEILTYANIFVSGISSDRIKSLSNSEKDLSNPDYLRIEQQLLKMNQAGQDSGIRWIYTMFLKDGNIIFGNN